MIYQCADQNFPDPRTRGVWLLRLADAFPWQRRGRDLARSSWRLWIDAYSIRRQQLWVWIGRMRYTSYTGPDLAGGGLGPSSLGVTKWETVKAYKD